MKKLRIGVMGVYRGTSMLNYCRQAECKKQTGHMDAAFNQGKKER